MQDSNPRPDAYKASALPPELIRHGRGGVNRTLVLPAPKAGAIPLGDTPVVCMVGVEPTPL